MVDKMRIENRPLLESTVDCCRAHNNNLMSKEYDKGAWWGEKELQIFVNFWVSRYKTTHWYDIRDKTSTRYWMSQKFGPELYNWPCCKWGLDRRLREFLHALCSCGILQWVYVIAFIAPQRHGTLSLALESGRIVGTTQDVDTEQHTSHHKRWRHSSENSVQYNPLPSNCPRSNLNLMRPHTLHWHHYKDTKLVIRSISGP